MESISTRRILLTSVLVGTALVLGGCSTVQPKFDSAVASVKSFFTGDGLPEAKPVEPSSEAKAMYASALEARAAGDEKEYARRLEAAADLGHPAAAYEIGIAYTEGRLVRKDAAEGARYINRSADLGDRRAQYLVGANFMIGTGVKKDPERGVAFLARAGEQGHVQAQYLLGMAYADGNGVARNPLWEPIQAVLR